MNKRILFPALLATLVAPAMAREKSAATFVVPKNVQKIRVRSYRDGKKVIDTSLNVAPGQTFTIDTV